MFAIYKRELASYFYSPTGYVVTAAFMIFNGIFLYVQCLYSGTSNLYNVFQSMFFILMFLIPLITMRLFAEDKKNKTDQALLTAPVGIPSIILAKFLSALTLLAVCLCSFLIDGILLSFVGSPDWSTLWGNILGMLLMGSAFISIGVLISSLTENVIIAAVFSFALSVIISMTDMIASTIPFKWIRQILNALSFQSRYGNFAIGLISLSDIVFFISITGLFLFLTDKVIDRRRWA